MHTIGHTVELSECCSTPFTPILLTHPHQGVATGQGSFGHDIGPLALRKESGDGAHALEEKDDGLRSEFMRLLENWRLLWSNEDSVMRHAQKQISVGSTL